MTVPTVSKLNAVNTVLRVEDFRTPQAITTENRQHCFISYYIIYYWLCFAGEIIIHWYSISSLRNIIYITVVRHLQLYLIINNFKRLILMFKLISKKKKKETAA